MKSMVMLVMLALAGIAGSGKADAQAYNLRTVPSVPTAGFAFLAAFDSTDCEVWMLLPDAQPPIITVQGNVVRLEVDRITVVDCSNEPYTNVLNVPALPAGNFQLELIARAYQSPGNDISAQAVSFQVGPPVASEARAIPVNHPAALALLVVIVLLPGFAFQGRTTSAQGSR